VQILVEKKLQKILASFCFLYLGLNGFLVFWFFVLLCKFFRWAWVGLDAKLGSSEMLGYY
jgi:hypothetical protein